MSESNKLTYYQRNKDMVLSKANNYYKNNNERLKNMQKINVGTYQNGKNRYHNMSEEKKQKLKEYQKRKYQESKKV